MPEVSYRARRSDGELVEGVLSGDSEAAVVAELRRQGLFVMGVEPRGGGSARSREATKSKGRGSLFGKRVRRKELMVFTSQFSILLRTGSNLVSALMVLEDQPENPYFGEVIKDVRSSVQGGEPLSEGLRKYPRIFDRVYVSMIRAGETSGTLTDTLKRLTQYIQGQAKLIGNLRSAIMYPAILCFISVAVVIFLMTVILPRFAKIFDNLGAELPGPTQFLIDVSGFFRNQWYFVLAGLVGVVVALKVLWQNYTVRKMVDAAVLQVTVVGKLIKTVYLTRIMRTMGVLLDSGIPILDAVQVSRNVITNVTYLPFFDVLMKDVTSGKGLSGSFGESRLIPSSVAQMVRTGEESGALSSVMLAVADHYEEEADRAIKDLTTFLEPAIIVVMGGLVGYIALSLVLPLFRMSGAIK